MSYEPIESFYLTDYELYVLLAGKGREQWYGFSQEKQGDGIRSVNDMHGILAQLYQKGVIRWKGKKAVLTEPFLPMIQTLVHARVCVNARKLQGGHSPSSHYFYDGQVVFLERSQRQADTLRLTQMHMGAWLDYMEEEGYFPDHIQDGDSEKFFFNIQPGRDFSSCEKDAYAVLEKTDTRTGRILERLFVEEKGLTSLLYLQREGVWLCSTCQRPNWSDILKAWAYEREEAV